jgi:hypothetical protein
MTPQVHAGSRYVTIDTPANPSLTPEEAIELADALCDQAKIVRQEIERQKNAKEQTKDWYDEIGRRR